MPDLAEIDDGRHIGSYARDVHTAVGLAIRAAQHDHGDRLDVIVCVQQKDGSYKVEWASQGNR